MTWHAVCTDCSWSREADSREAVTEAVERHSRKEYHYVELKRQTSAVG